MDQKSARLLGRQRADDGADLAVRDLAAQPVTAQQKRIARLNGVRTIDVHLYQWLGPQ